MPTFVDPEHQDQGLSDVDAVEVLEGYLVEWESMTNPAWSDEPLDYTFYEVLGGPSYTLSCLLAQFHRKGRFVKVTIEDAGPNPQSLFEIEKRARAADAALEERRAEFLASQPVKVFGGRKEEVR